MQHKYTHMEYTHMEYTQRLFFVMPVMRSTAKCPMLVFYGGPCAKCSLWSLCATCSLWS